MTLNLPWFWFVEYWQTSPNKNKSPNLWHITSILVCCIFRGTYITVIQIAESCSEIWFDIWFLETGQLCLILIRKGHFFLKKFVQGHKGQKGQWRPTTIECKIVNKCEYITKKRCFLKTHFSSIIFTFIDDFTLNSDNNK